jgi:hypothetical protein
MDQLDGHEADALESMELSEGWALVHGRVCEVIEQKRDALERGPLAMGDQTMEYHCGFLAACRMVLALPKQMAQEIQGTVRSR